MKIYRNKLYSIQDAAKKSGITEDQINEMITHHVIIAHYYCSKVRSIWGEDIPRLKAEWDEWRAKKGRMKRPNVTMLKMKEGD